MLHDAHLTPKGTFVKNAPSVFGSGDLRD